MGNEAILGTILAAILVLVGVSAVVLIGAVLEQMLIDRRSRRARQCRRAARAERENTVTSDHRLHSEVAGRATAQSPSSSSPQNYSRGAGRDTVYDPATDVLAGSIAYRSASHSSDFSPDGSGGGGED